MIQKNPNRNGTPRIFRKRFIGNESIVVWAGSDKPMKSSVSVKRN